MNKRQLMDEITNFIEYYTSDDAERQKMSDTLLDYMLDVYQEPEKHVYFRREPDLINVRVDGMPEFKIAPSEIEKYTKQFLQLKYVVHVG